MIFRRCSGEATTPVFASVAGAVVDASYKKIMKLCSASSLPHELVDHIEDLSCVSNCSSSYARIELAMMPHCGHQHYARCIHTLHLDACWSASLLTRRVGRPSLRPCQQGFRAAGTWTLASQRKECVRISSPRQGRTRVKRTIFGLRRKRNLSGKNYK